MKTAFFGLGLAVIAASVNGMDYEVASCAELADIDDTTVTSLTITSSPFLCDSYTRFRVRNDMVLKSDSAVEFSNFALKVLGTLTVEPDVTFQDVTEQMTHGGALYVERDSSATFLGAASFIGNSVISVDFPPIQSAGGGFRNSYLPRNGGAVFNKGDLVFEGDALFVSNEAVTTDDNNKGRGGAIYNARVGTITFNGQLTAIDNQSDGYDEGEGGAIFNSGAITVEGTSLFTDNDSSDGGAIYNRPQGTMTFNAFANFTENSCSDRDGGAIFSTGSMNLMGGSLFLRNIASSNEDGGDGGGIFNGEGGSLSFGGTNTFQGNLAFTGGAIYHEEGSSVSGGELIFESNRADTCPDIYTRGADPVCSP